MKNAFHKSGDTLHRECAKTLIALPPRHGDSIWISLWWELNEAMIMPQLSLIHSAQYRENMGKKNDDTQESLRHNRYDRKKSVLTDCRSIGRVVRTKSKESIRFHRHISELVWHMIRSTLIRVTVTTRNLEKYIRHFQTKSVLGQAVRVQLFTLETRLWLHPSRTRYPLSWILHDSLNRCSGVKTMKWPPYTRLPYYITFPP